MLAQIHEERMVQQVFIWLKLPASLLIIGVVH